ncbi:MAG: SpaH/EbpB family LPXTG-anchored major pilin [Microbacteriaceae bacterium]|nr:SpaH/EbpB family LPXTG-anchored major pilin [Microbacteriaceae bacterium]
MIRRLFIASVLAAAVALPLAATMTTPASAATSLPDPSRLASLTVIDTAVPSGGVAETPVTGAGYVLERVLPVDLTSRAGWSAAAALAAEIDTTSIVTTKASIAAAGRTLSAAGAATTDASGRATFAGLPLGLYLIEPVSAPSGSTLPAPSLIALPQTDPSNGSQWLYDVVVHPKSGATTITKTVADDTSTGPGARVTWTVLAGIPRPTSPGRPLAGYLLVDRLDVRLAYRGATVALRDPGTGARTPVPSADYTITTQRSGVPTRCSSGSSAPGWRCWPRMPASRSNWPSRRP